jgi:prepilin-type processing-associated H-X9-DG protein
MFNYESAYSRFPAPAFSSVMNFSGGGSSGSPLGTAGLLTTTVWSLAILPQIDQANTFNLYNSNLSDYDPANANAVKTVINAYLCPSTPRSGNTITFTNPYVVGTLSTSPVTLSSAGANDYISTNQVDPSFVAYINSVSGTSIPNGNLQGWATDGITVAGSLINTPTGGRIADITDGLSNTTMIGELAGRNVLYYTGNKIQPATNPLPATPDSDGTWQFVCGGGAWADGTSGIWDLSGRNPDGTGVIGPCTINCSNSRSALGGGNPLLNSAGLYSFHTGGAHVLFCDGSVRFLNSNINVITMIGLITRQNGETLGEF